MTAQQGFNFADYRDRLIKALTAKGNDLGINEPISLIDGFIQQPIQQDISGAFVIGGPSIPMVAAVGNRSSRIYFFALKALIPDIQI